tara:strand:- start:4739 stop:5338 length:600 start_codon:yes stop_codon:yes gene_type:complete
MTRKILVAAAASALLAACGQNEPELPAETPTPVPEQTQTPEPLPEPNPAALKSEISASWTPADLVGSERVSVELSDAETAILTGTDTGDEGSGGSTGGAHVVFELPSTRDISNNTLIISVRAKSVGDDPTPFSVAYSTNVKGNSGWREFEATATAETYTFEYGINDPPNKVDLNGDYIGIMVPTGSSIEVESISLAVAE